ncbi:MULTISPECIES: tRNA lysidine(34) synthetase TilS [Prochlorococcus]|uniref:tRNA lysidine(34) synthetase TilS n=1 Tax=Prochlorococcus TaxID=1218 RepID=UPI00053395B7|nr:MULTISPECIES: tRNA lysidine(34) synthetase TilS [Prochlorococcus]KGG13679.1 tRNA(Ile)-lysidine synthetase [Prochlorococcus sp. MIT 0601]
MTQPSKSEMPWGPWHTRLHKTLIKKKNLLPAGSGLILSVSGGQDSMALLKLIIDLKRLYHWEIHVWHGDHGWHKDSSKIASELGEWCRSKKINFYSERLSSTKLQTEEAARNWRYQRIVDYLQSLKQKYQSISFQCVLTGHTSTDRTETLLLNLARGAYIGGLGSLRYSRTLKGSIKLIRPLLPFSRDDTAEICKEMNLPIWIDPSNSNMNFSRNRIRKEVLPVLEKLHPGSTIRIASLAERLSNLQDDREALTSLAIEAISKLNGLSRKKLIELPTQTRETIFAKWLDINGVPHVKASQLAEISQSINKGMPPGSRDLAQGWKIVWDQECVQVFCTQ